MSSTSTKYSLKSIARELFTYKSGVLGIALLSVLIGLSAYTIVTIPYDQAIRLWRGEGGVWLEAPRNAEPYWVNLLGNNLPETIIRDTSNLDESGTIKIITSIPQTTLKLGRISFTFDYRYDDFPNEVNLFISSKFNESAPILRIYWIKPGESEIKLLDYIPRSKDDQLYLTTNTKVLDATRSYIISILNEEPDVLLPPEIAMFAVEDETMESTLTAIPLKGQYKLNIETTLFGDEADLDVKMVVYGKVYGIAGTDHLRRDLTVALLWGTPIALAFGLTASVTISFIQLLIAAISGYYGGKTDSLIQRMSELYMILPFLPILIMISTFYKFDIGILLVVVIGLNIFGGGVKSTRALVMQIKEYPYIEAAKAYGASSKRIIFFYIIPKILPPVIPSLIGSVPAFVFLEAALSILGLGVPYLPSWGKVIDESFRYGALYKGYYYWVLEPALMLVVTAFAFSFLGFALDKIVNPKLREV
jgi:peptide/nickel transport system permease protein